MDWMVCSTNDWVSACCTCPDIKSHAQQISEGLTFATIDDYDLAGIPVKATGATSGCQNAVVNGLMSLVYHVDRPSLRTIEWALCKKDDVSHEHWVNEGFGRPGDSGSWVIGEHDNVVYGMSWGRGKSRSGQTISLFTPIFEILADINRRRPFTTFSIPGMPAQDIKTYLRILEPFSNDPASSLSLDSAINSEEDEDRSSIENENLLAHGLPEVIQTLQKPELRSVNELLDVEESEQAVEKPSDPLTHSRIEPGIAGEDATDDDPMSSPLPESGTGSEEDDRSFIEEENLLVYEPLDVTDTPQTPETRSVVRLLDIGEKKKDNENFSHHLTASRSEPAIVGEDGSEDEWEIEPLC